MPILDPDSWTVRIIKAICSAFIFAATMTVIFTVGPAMETRFWPVVGKLEILRTERLDADHAKIWVAFDKRRNCEYLGLSWFLRDDAVRPAFDRVVVQMLREPGDTASPTRPVGYQRAGPWIIAIPAELIATRSFARLYHRCHSFWLTTTDFYP